MMMCDWRCLAIHALLAFLILHNMLEKKLWLGDNETNIVHILLERLAIFVHNFYTLYVVYARCKGHIGWWDTFCSFKLAKMYRSYLLLTPS